MKSGVYRGGHRLLRCVYREAIDVKSKQDLRSRKKKGEVGQRSGGVGWVIFILTLSWEVARASSSYLTLRHPFLLRPLSSAALDF